MAYALKKKKTGHSVYNLKHATVELLSFINCHALFCPKWIHKRCEIKWYSWHLS